MIAINDRLNEILLGGGGLSAEPGDINFHTHIDDPATMVKPDSVMAYDRAAVAAIARLESIKADLELYRIALGQRYAHLATAPTIPVVKLTAENDGKRTYYYLRVYRRYTSGEEYEENGKQFLEDERDIAIREFADYKRTHPGILSEMDI